jgi:hypothetical protein
MWLRVVRRATAVALLILLGTGCGVLPGGSHIKVQAETLPWVDVSRYRTYAWWAAPLEASRSGYSQTEALLDWRVRKAVDRDLQARGYAPATTGRADFVVAYRLAISEASTESFRDYLAYRAEGGGQGMGDSFMDYQRGTLMLTVEDAATRRLAWRAQATAALEGGDGRGSKIDPAVSQMIARFPVAAR